jgi:hypothetical protein
MSLDHSPGAARAGVSATSESSDLLWGAGEIAAVLNRSERATWHMLSKGEIACARKKGGKWVASRSALLREFGGGQ